MVDATPQTDTRRLLVLLSLGAFLAIGTAAAQQQADTLFQPAVSNPAYAPGAGPGVLVDEAHHNYHTVEGRYQAFASVLRWMMLTAASGPMTEISAVGQAKLISARRCLEPMAS